LETDAEKRGLELIEAGVRSQPAREMARALAVHAEVANSLGKIWIGGHDCACVPEGVEILRRIEGEASRDAERAGRPSVDLKAVRLRGVLDDGQTELEQLNNRRRTPIEMHRDDRRRRRRASGGGALWIDRERLAVDVDEDGPVPGPDDCCRRGD
jgi:hypothetical protein